MNVKQYTNKRGTEVVIEFSEPDIASWTNQSFTQLGIPATGPATFIEFLKGGQSNIPELVSMQLCAEGPNVDIPAGDWGPLIMDLQIGSAEILVPFDSLQTSDAEHLGYDTVNFCVPIDSQTSQRLFVGFNALPFDFTLGFRFPVRISLTTYERPSYWNARNPYGNYTAS